MGCSQSKLDDEEAVRLCKDRKRFIRQAVEQRTRFAAGHLAYIESLKRVSAALRDYIEGDEPREFSLDSVVTPTFTPVKKAGPGFISAKQFTPTAIEFGVGPNATLKVNYLRPGGNPAVVVEERPPSPETVRVETYSPMQQYGNDGYFAMQSPPMNYPSIFPYSPNNRPNIRPPSPQNSQWDFFWNPFSSLDYYGYTSRSSLDQHGMDDEYKGLRQVREEEGIPDLEEDETEQEDYVGKRNVAEERPRNDINSSKEEVIVEDVVDDDDDDDEEEEEEDDDDDEEAEEDEEEGTNTETQTQHDVKHPQARGSASFEVSKSQAAGHIDSGHREMAIGNQEAKEETPGFTVYVNRRPTSMAEVINELEAQFTVVCNAANDVSVLLEAKKAQYLLTSNELSASKLLNPVALFRTASSRSSSSRFLMNSSSTKEEDYEGCRDKGTKDISEEHCSLSGSHQSTLDKLNAWEKKLYEEVKSGERVRIAYEKKIKQLRNHEVKGEDPFSADKTRAAIRDLDTQITVSIHSVEAISRRIETLRDKELHPQLLELVQRMEKMWKVMAECHQTQKRTLDEAKILLAGTPSKLQARKQSSMSMTDPNRLARSASILESELRNWRNTFESWITSQRSYIHALAGWLLRCVRSEPDDDVSKLPCSPSRSSGTHPLFGLCVQWSRRLDAMREKAVLDGMDFFAAGMGSLYAHQLRQDSSRPNSYESRQTGGNMEMVEVGQVEEEVMAPEKLAEVAIKVLCAGMSVAISSLSGFAFDSAEAYSEVIKQWEIVKDPAFQCAQGWSLVKRVRRLIASERRVQLTHVYREANMVVDELASLECDLHGTMMVFDQPLNGSIPHHVKQLLVIDALGVSTSRLILS